MHTAFGDVIWIVCGIGVVIGFLSLIGSGKTWAELGKHGLLMERDSGGGGGGGEGALSAASVAERDTEIRQMLEARNARRARRGEELVDVESELRRLTAPAQTVDASLRSEIRDMVVARNYRRARRGEAPLEVEAEVEREIARLTSGD